MHSLFSILFSGSFLVCSAFGAMNEPRAVIPANQMLRFDDLKKMVIDALITN